MVYKIRGNPIGFSEPLFTGTKITKIRHVFEYFAQKSINRLLTYQPKDTDKNADFKNATFRRLWDG